MFAEWNGTSPVVYISFDHLHRLVFMEGDVMVNLPLLQGKVLMSFFETFVFFS